MTFTPSRPITIKRTAGGYRIEDKTERTLLYIYCRKSEAVARAAGVLTFPEGEELAKTVARALEGKG